jgi:hypothetical protein
MKKKLRIGVWFLLVVVAILVIFVPENRLSILGYFRGENRFQGRPTSYWRYKVGSYAAQKERNWPSRPIIDVSSQSLGTK